MCWLPLFTWAGSRGQETIQTCIVNVMTQKPMTILFLVSSGNQILSLFISTMFTMLWWLPFHPRIEEFTWSKEEANRCTQNRRREWPLNCLPSRVLPKFEEAVSLVPQVFFRPGEEHSWWLHGNRHQSVKRSVFDGALSLEGVCWPFLHHSYLTFHQESRVSSIWTECFLSFSNLEEMRTSFWLGQCDSNTSRVLQVGWLV